MPWERLLKGWSPRRWGDSEQEEGSANTPLPFMGPTDTFDGPSYEAEWVESGFGSSLPTIVAGRSRHVMSTEYSQTNTDNIYTFSEAQVTVEVDGSELTTPQEEIYLVLFSADATPDEQIVLGVFNQEIYSKVGIVGSEDAAVHETYDPDVHVWWRIRESGGSVFFDYSVDGTAWVNLRSLAHNLETLDNFLIVIGAGTTSGGTGAFAYFDNLNTNP